MSRYFWRGISQQYKYLTNNLKSSRECFHTSQPFNKKTDIVPKNVLELNERELFIDIFPPAGVAKEIFLQKQTFYCGFDPTADSLHVGNLVAIMALLYCQRAGHDIIAVIGTATAKAGDPSDQTKDRHILDEKQINGNAEKISKNLQNIFDNHALHIYDNRFTKNMPSSKILLNYSWYKDYNAIDFISNVGKFFRLAPMIYMKFIKERISSKEGLLLSEFFYQVFQAYDWKYLHDKYECSFQIGGMDQLGNMTAGQQLIKKTSHKSVYGLLTPLVTTPRGQKLGKTAGNSVWLNAEKTPPFEFYQYFYRQPDSVVERFLKLFTFIDLKSIEEIMEKHKRQPQQRQAQEVLARNVCKIVHGPEGLASAERCTLALYSSENEHLESLSEEEIATTFSGFSIIDCVLESDTTIYDAAVQAKAIPSGLGGENIIKAGGVRINNEFVTNPLQILLHDRHVLKNDLSVLVVGKKTHFIIRWKLPRVEFDETMSTKPFGKKFSKKEYK